MSIALPAFPFLFNQSFGSIPYDLVMYGVQFPQSLPLNLVFFSHYISMALVRTERNILKELKGVSVNCGR
jgi:hypothetical protein